MSINSVVQLLFLGAITLQQATATKWVQIWSDEFDGSQIDTSKWGHDQGNWGWGNNELENYTDRPENSYIQDGNLVIQANQENLGGSQYTSARMTTQGKFSTLYGKVEARAKLPHGQGIWAAFWLLGEKYEWPMNGMKRMRNKMGVVLNLFDRSDNAFVSDGFLHIQALRENYGDAQYTSAKLNTAGKFTIQYGKFEMRAKLPQGQGMWPAFWLLGENIGNVGWPACGEIDIMELVGKDPQNVYASLHAPSYDTTRGYHLNQGFAGDFHTYGVNWQPEQIDFYVDGNTYLSVNKNQSGGHWPFTDGKFFIILNLAVGGFWPGNPDGSTQFPQQYVVDYVRVWEIDWSLENENAQFLN